MPSELFLKFRKEIQGFRVGVNLEVSFLFFFIYASTLQFWIVPSICYMILFVAFVNEVSFCLVTVSLFSHLSFRHPMNGISFSYLIWKHMHQPVQNRDGCYFYMFEYLHLNFGISSTMLQPMISRQSLCWNLYPLNGGGSSHTSLYIKMYAFFQKRSLWPNFLISRSVVLSLFLFGLED